MNEKIESVRKKIFRKVVDQRPLILPPMLIENISTRAKLKEQGMDVHESGTERSVAKLLVGLLEQASEKIVLSSFLLADSEIEESILSASRRGVRIYILLSSEARLDQEDSDDEFEKTVIEQHKKMLNTLGGYVLFRSAPHFHAKILIVDPDTAPQGILLTSNITSAALERNQELAITLTEDEIQEAMIYLKWAMWEMSEHELVDPNDRFKSVRPLNKLKHPPSMKKIKATTMHSHSILDTSMDLFRNAKTKIVVSCFGWDVHHETVNLLCQRAREGVDVTILARVRQSSMPALIALAESGAKIYLFRWLHAKAILVDSREAIVMSANFEKDGMDKGFELGIYLNDARVDRVLERLEVWRERAQWKLVLKPTLGDVSGSGKIWMNNNLRDVSVESAKEVNLGVLVADSADHLIAKEPEFPKTGMLPEMVHELHYSWAVEAPTLHSKSKEQFKKVSNEASSKKDNSHKSDTSYHPSLYREPSGRLVVAVKSSEEISAAQQLRREVKASAIVLAPGFVS